MAARVRARRSPRPIAASTATDAMNVRLSIIVPLPATRDAASPQTCMLPRDYASRLRRRADDERGETNQSGHHPDDEDPDGEVEHLVARHVARCGGHGRERREQEGKRRHGSPAEHNGPRRVVAPVAHRGSGRGHRRLAGRIRDRRQRRNRRGLRRRIRLLCAEAPDASRTVHTHPPTTVTTHTITSRPIVAAPIGARAGEVAGPAAAS